VDYIFTDPPYGAHIAYLDLSILWNHWLGFRVNDEVRQAEAIVGGECNLSEAHYKQKLSEGIRGCITMLRPDRWFSIVFQHWDVSYFATILETTSSAGAQLRAAVTQESAVVWSMHKKKNSESVLSGEMILTFYKPLARRAARPLHRPVLSAPVDFTEILDRVLATHEGKGSSFTTEFLFNQVILEAWESNCLGVLSVSHEDFADHLRSRGWTYSAKSHEWCRSKRREKLCLWDD
jgi:hypothetical protein